MQISENHEDVKPIHGGGMTKRPPTGLSPITSTNIGISPPKSFWLLILALLSHWCKISR